MSGTLFGYLIQMAWLIFGEILWIFDWIMPIFRLVHRKSMEPYQQIIWRTAWARIMIFGTQIAPKVLITLLTFGKIL